MYGQWWATVIGAASAVLGMALGILTQRRAAKKEAGQVGKTEGVIMTELSYIKAGVDEIRGEYKALRQQQQNLAERMARAEEGIGAVKSVSLRIKRGEYTT